MFIPDPDLDFYPSRIPGSKRHRIPDPDPQVATLAKTRFNPSFSGNFIFLLNIDKVRYLLTINVPVVFMARYVMVLRGAKSLRVTLKWVGPENRDFFGP